MYLSNILAQLLLVTVLASSSWSTLAKGERHLLPDGTSVQFEAFRGAQTWQLFPNLFAEVTVNVTCPDKKSFEIYVAPTHEGMVEKAAAKQSAWCGWKSFMGQTPSSCATSISPFGDTYVGAARPRTAGIFSGKECTFMQSKITSYFRIMMLLAGVFLFHFGPYLSKSLAFRLGTGSVGFALLSVLILVFVVARMLPNKRSIAAAFLAAGGAVTTACHHFFGSYIPSLPQLVQHPVLLAYLAASALVGLALTYYFDSPDNVKLLTILEVGLQLGGLALVALSTSMPEASIALVCLLVAWRLWPAANALWISKPTRVEDVVQVVQQSLSGNRSAASSPQGFVQSSAPQSHNQLPLSTPTPLANGGQTPTLGGTRSFGAAASELLDARTPAGGESAWVGIGGLQVPPEATPQASHGRGGNSLVQKERFSFRRFAAPPLPGDEEISPAPIPNQRTDHRQQQSHSTSPSQQRTPRQRVSSPRSPSSDRSPAQSNSSAAFGASKGMLLNEATNRAVKVDGATYQRLIAEGYTVDQQRGRLTPPLKGSGSGGTPSASTRKRRS